jgi:putative hydrolase of the HAD superfamily
VLSLAPTLEDYEPLRAAIGVEPAAFQEIYWKHREAYDVDAIDAATYWQGIAQAAGATFTPEQIQKVAMLDIQMWERPNPPMMEWVRVLRAQGMKMAVLSNMSRTVGDYFRRTAKWIELFDHVCFSGELRMVKPDAAIYYVSLRALGEAAVQTLFIDDREVNVAGARALGMPAILFTTVEQLYKDLEPFELTASLRLATGRSSPGEGIAAANS